MFMTTFLCLMFVVWIVSLFVYYPNVSLHLSFAFSSFGLFFHASCSVFPPKNVYVGSINCTLSSADSLSMLLFIFPFTSE